MSVKFNKYLVFVNGAIMLQMAGSGYKIIAPQYSRRLFCLSLLFCISNKAGLSSQSAQVRE